MARARAATRPRGEARVAEVVVARAVAAKDPVVVEEVAVAEAVVEVEVEVEALPGNPEAAIDAVIQRLDRDVRERPWAWWHWGLWDQMWQPVASEERSNV